MKLVQKCLISIALYIMSNQLSHGLDSFDWETFNETLSMSGYESQLVTGSDGIPTAIWLECTDSSCSKKSLIASRYETDQWSSPTVIASSEYINVPRLAASIHGELLAVWLEQGVTVKSSWWKNGSWAPADTIAQNTSANLMEAVVDSEGVATVIWSMGQVEVARSQGDHWASSETLCKVETTESGYSWCGEPQLAVDRDNVVTAAWVASRSQSPDGLNAPISSRFENGKWDEPVNITDETTGQHRLLRLASDKIGTVTAFWVLGSEAQSSQYYDSVWHPVTYVGPSSISGYIQSDSAKLMNIGKDVIMSVWGGGRLCIHNCEQGPFQSANLISGQWSTPRFLSPNMVDLATDGLGHAMLLDLNNTKVFDEYGWRQPIIFTGMPLYSRPVNITMSSVRPPIMLLSSNLGLMAKHGIPNALTVTIQKKGLGTVVSQPQGLDCGNACIGYFHPGSTMNLYPIATPESGYGFSNWEGDCGGTGVCRLTVDSNKIVTAKFLQLPKFRITVAKPVGGHVIGYSISSGTQSDTDIFCPNDCANKYYKGEEIVFQARANDNYYFQGWHGCDIQSEKSCTVFLERQNMHVKAIFKKKPKYVLILRKSTYGSVETNLPVGNCAAYKTKCVFNVPEGSEVLLIMKPKPGKTYLGWAGDCGGTQPECKLIMNREKFVEALFE
jgi:hypothetical protein